MYVCLCERDCIHNRSNGDMITGKQAMHMCICIYMYIYTLGDSQLSNG